jgi:hypothetical protein
VDAINQNLHSPAVAQIFTLTSQLPVSVQEDVLVMAAALSRKYARAAKVNSLRQKVDRCAEATKLEAVFEYEDGFTRYYHVLATRTRQTHLHHVQVWRDMDGVSQTKCDCIKAVLLLECDHAREAVAVENRRSNAEAR